jgi:adenine phosphoribosyltransferase
MAIELDLLRAHVRDIPDWPRPGVVFKDITPLLGDAKAFSATLDLLAAAVVGHSIDKVLGVEARGFLFSAPLADRFGAGLVPVRKAGKLPWQIEQQEYELEYGTDLLEIHKDAVHPGEQVLIVDDVLATGGTSAATARLVHRLGGIVVGFAFVIELAFLHGRAQLDAARDALSAEGALDPWTITSLLTYGGAEDPSVVDAAAVPVGGED